MQGFNSVPWKFGFRESFVATGALADDPRGCFLIPRVNLHTTFALRITAFTGGLLSTKLRFGFSGVVPLSAWAGCDSTAINALEQIVIMRQDYSNGIAPGANPMGGGEPDGISPPVVRVFTTVSAGATLTYEVLYSCIYLP